MANPDFAPLVTKAQTGDRAAFEQLIRSTSRIVYAQIVAAVRDRHKAEDLTQETFLAAWKSIHTMNDPSGFVSWLLTLARNTTLDHAKFAARQKRKIPLGFPATREAAASEPAPPQTLENTEARNNALRLLEELPSDYREPLMLRYLAGADNSTIRAQLNLTDGALRGLLNRGMTLLRERMNPTEKQL